MDHLGPYVNAGSTQVFLCLPPLPVISKRNETEAHALCLVWGRIQQFDMVCLWFPPKTLNWPRFAWKYPQLCLEVVRKAAGTYLVSELTQNRPAARQINSPD